MILEHGWHLAAGAHLDCTLLFGIGDVCSAVVFCFFDVDAWGTHCRGVGVLTFLQCSLKDRMDTPSYGSPVRAYVNNQYSMHMSHDDDQSDPKDLSSLGVVDLDLSISPHAFGLRAFDITKPLTRMLPGQFANEIRLGIAPAGFHDIVIENLAATPTWRSHRLLSGDVTSLRRR